MKKRLWIAIVFSVLLGACDRAADVSVPAVGAGTSAPTNTQPAAPSGPTRAEWKAAVAGTYDETKREDKGDGNTEFVACFARENGKCKLLTFGRHDAFSKLTFFVPPSTQLGKFRHEPRVETHVVVGECERPDVVVQAVYETKGSWLFMNRVSFMVDGDVELERRFEFNEVKRDNDTRGIEERAAWLLSADDLVRMGKIVDGSERIVRLTGDKGYATLDRDGMKDFTASAQTSLEVHRILAEAVSSVNGPTCTDKN